MADKELVVQKLKILLEKDVLCENYRDAVVDAVQMLDDQDDTVQCKDCKYCWAGYCNRGTNFRPVTNDVLCAYGVKKE